VRKRLVVCDTLFDGITLGLEFSDSAISFASLVNFIIEVYRWVAAK
jgi:hypothetical protein